MVMLSAHAVPPRIVIYSTNAEANASFLNIARVPLDRVFTNRYLTHLLEPGGRMKSDSKRLKARNNPNRNTFN